MDILTTLTIVLILIGTIANIYLIKRLMKDEQYFEQLDKLPVLKKNPVVIKRENEF